MTDGIENKGYLIDYRLLRLLMGIIAIAMPIVVSLWSHEKLSSISASYHTAAQDIFVGMLFSVGTFLIAYRGTANHQKTMLATKIGAMGAFAAALFPISPDGCPMDTSSYIHNMAALILFGSLAYICLKLFRDRAKGKSGLKPLRRYFLYTVCGYGIIGSILFIVAAWSLERIGILPNDALLNYRIIFVGEGVALGCFGSAWFVAGKWWIFSYYVDKNEAYRPLQRKAE